MTRKIAASALCSLLAACGAPSPFPQVPGGGAPPLASASTETQEGSPLASRVAGASPLGEIAAMEALLTTTAKTSPERPRILRRLAEGYVTVETAAQRNGDPTGEAAARAARHRAIDCYTQIVAEYPSWCSGADKGCLDEVLFHLAQELEQDQAPVEARKVYREIIKGWPLSRYLPHAYLAFADMYFDEGARDPPKLALAEKAYLEVLRFPPKDNDVAAYAHYKLAWVRVNRNDPARALQEMLQAIEVSEATPNLPSAARLAKAARHDLAPIYASGGDPAKAYDFFFAHSGDKPPATEKLHDLLEALAKAYVDTGKLEEAVEIYVDWLSRGAGNETCPVVKEIDAVIARAAGTPGLHTKVRLTASASAPLMKARVECASTP